MPLSSCRQDIHHLFSDNIALGKPTSQIGTWENYTSDLAVDGNYNQHLTKGKSCAFPSNENGSVWWMVDLAGPNQYQRFVVKNVIIRFRIDYRIKGKHTISLFGNPYV